MKKRFLKLALLSLLTVALPTTFTGCKDYDDDIDNLENKTDDLQKQINTLSEALKGYQSEATTAAQAAKDAAAKAQTTADKAEKDAAEAKALAEAAKSAAAQAKADAVAEIIKELEGYATADDLDAVADRITAVEATLKTLTGGSDVTNLAQAVATLQNQVKALEKYTTLLEQLNALGNAAEQIKKATDAITTINGEINTIKSNYSDLTEDVSGLDKKLNTLSTLVGSINQNLVVIMGKQLRSLVFIPELYADGIESVEYEYNAFKPWLTATGSLTNVKNEEGVFCTVISKPEMWNFTRQGAEKAFNPVKTVDYHMNPSSAIVTADQVSFISKDVQVISRASVAALAIQKDAFKTEKGIMTVGFTANGPKIKTGDQKEGSIFAANAKIQKNGQDTTITSDYAMLYASQVIPQAIAFNNNVPQALNCPKPNHNDELYTDLEDAIKNAPSRTVVYTGSINLNELEIHYNWVTKTKNAGEHLVWKYGEEKHYGLSYEYALIDYTSGTNKTSESKYCKLSGDENSILTPWAVNAAGEPEYEHGIASVGRQPIVRVTVKCGDDVVLRGFIKVQIVKEEAFKISNLIDLGNINFGCDDAVKSVSWSTISDYILQNTAALSKDEFNQLYKLSVDSDDEAIQYVYNATRKTFAQAQASEYIGVVEEVSNAEGMTTDVLKWTLTTEDQQVVYEKAGNTATIYVAYVHRTAPTIYATIYIPLQVKVTKPNAATVKEKVAANWMREKTVTIFNVPQPTDGALPTPFTQNLNEAWATGSESKPSFTVQDGFPSFTAATFTTQGVNLSTGGYKFYFTAGNNRTLDGVTYSVDNAKVQGLLPGNSHNVAVKDMGVHALLEENGEYTNTKLYAKIPGATNRVVIATIDQNTGVITYEENAASKYVLNLYASNGNGLDRTNAKLFAEIGICAYSKCGIALPLTNGVYPNVILRPINVYSTEATFTDAVANGSKVDVFSHLSFDDWRGKKFEGADAWLFAYYDVTKVDVRLKDMTTNAVNGTFQKFQAVTDAFSLENNAAMTWMNRTEANAANILNKAKNSFGTIVYDNRKYNKNTFKVRIPVDVTYYWGTITVTVEATVNNTLNPGN